MSSKVCLAGVAVLLLVCSSCSSSGDPTADGEPSATVSDGEGDGVDDVIENGNDADTIDEESDVVQSGPVGDSVIDSQREALAEATTGLGFGPQSPRDIDQVAGENNRSFSEAPEIDQMNLCNIHFHENAEHKGGEFTLFAGNGDGEGYGTGFKYSGELSEAELAPSGSGPIADESHGELEPGDTIELHYVYTTALAEPGPTLEACLSDSIGNTQLRVEAQVLVLTNDGAGADFMQLTEMSEVEGYFQAPNIPTTSGTPVQYEGSTTGPTYNETGSPFQVSWSVRPDIVKADISSVRTWLDDNIFDEDHAHGVRNLITNPDLLSTIN